MACKLLDAKRLPEVLDTMYPAFWVDKEGLQLREVFEPALERVLGREVAKDVIALVIHNAVPRVRASANGCALESI